MIGISRLRCFVPSRCPSRFLLPLPWGRKRKVICDERAGGGSVPSVTAPSPPTSGPSVVMTTNSGLRTDRRRGGSVSSRHSAIRRAPAWSRGKRKNRARATIQRVSPAAPLPGKTESSVAAADDCYQRRHHLHHPFLLLLPPPTTTTTTKSSHRKRKSSSATNPLFYASTLNRSFVDKFWRLKFRS